MRTPALVCAVNSVISRCDEYGFITHAHTVCVYYCVGTVAGDAHFQHGPTSLKVVITFFKSVLFMVIRSWSSACAILRLSPSLDPNLAAAPPFSPGTLNFDLI